MHQTLDRMAEEFKMRAGAFLQIFESKMEGRLLYWVKPQKRRHYIVGCDSASGRGIESMDQEDVKEGATD